MEILMGLVPWSLASPFRLRSLIRATVPGFVTGCGTLRADGCVASRRLSCARSHAHGGADVAQVIAAYLAVFVLGIPMAIAVWWRRARQFSTDSKVMDKTALLFMQMVSAGTQLKSTPGGLPVCIRARGHAEPAA